ncbi:MAG: hypothetical protein CL610_22950 [Anaerolineaceae bacterium]|nr:hypothetical protein [Anaerolineaceae bacterium]
MINPDELLELGRERQRTLIAWRGNRWRTHHLPLVDMAVITSARRVLNAFLTRLRALNQGHTTFPAATHRSRQKP